MFSVEIEGLDPLLRKMKHIKATTLRLKQRPASFIKASTLGRITNMVEQRFRYPRKPRYPLRWKSEKQRRFVMAKLRRENNLPYSRSNRLANAWETEKDNHELTIYNDAKDPTTGQFYAPYVIGNEQQPFHADTGWVKGEDAIWRTIADKIGHEVMTEFVDELAVDLI